MKKEILYSLKGIYRENFEIEGYSFGGGEKSACIVGALRGNEIQPVSYTHLTLPTILLV